MDGLQLATCQSEYQVLVLSSLVREGREGSRSEEPQILLFFLPFLPLNLWGL